MLRKMEFHDIDQVARMHREELPGFLSELGEGFLKRFYKASLFLPEIFTIVLVKNGQFLGFVSCATRLGGLYKKIFAKDPFGFASVLLSYSVTHPEGIVRLIKTMVYPGFYGDVPELLTIVVAKSQRNRGFGEKLFLGAFREFGRRGVKSFRVSVYGKLPANGFYKKIGCRFEKQFDFVGEKMNYYRYGDG